MLTGNLNATRFAQKPIPQPTYNFSHVPKAEQNLRGSVVQSIAKREDFQWCMAEMLLICKESTRRLPVQRESGGCKPLSLEYLADRLDIDDPCFGYMVRTHENLHNDENWKKGMLQGFISVTTFTNWQKTFEWDSLNVAAYENDSAELSVASGLRKWDSDGSLSRAMQPTVRCGDIWNEGIVWPRIAEISLLGALGCGRALVSLVIEDLERMKPSATANYDFVALQATDNSIPFYEKMGFVRVGTVMKEDEERERKRQKIKKGKSDDNDDITEIVSSGAYLLSIDRGGQTITDISMQCQVDPWDVIFFNQHIANLSPSTKVTKGIDLFIPLKVSSHQGTKKPNLNDFHRSWHTAKENETPRSIAKKYSLSCIDLVRVNKRRLPGLIAASRLKDGTRVQISHFDAPTNNYKPYSHWSFPDDEFEEGEPSYMMVRRLHRHKLDGSSVDYPFRNSLAAVFRPYEDYNLLLPVLEESSIATKVVNLENTVPKQPFEMDNVSVLDQPKNAFAHFVDELNELADGEISGLSVGQLSKLFGDLWRDLPDEIKSIYEHMANSESEEFDRRREHAAEATTNICTSSVVPSSDPVPTTVGVIIEPCQSLFNTVVKLRPGAMVEFSEYEYWYVLNFIPDLKWCLLAPMIRDGTFGSDKPKAVGRPKWKLVDENLFKEVDISSHFCIPVKSRAMRKTFDADREEWDIMDDGSLPRRTTKPSKRLALAKEEDETDLSFTTETESRSKSDTKKRGRRTPPIKPSVERKRICSDVANTSPNRKRRRSAQSHSNFSKRVTRKSCSNTKSRRSLDDFETNSSNTSSHCSSSKDLLKDSSKSISKDDESDRNRESSSSPTRTRSRKSSCVRSGRVVSFPSLCSQPMRSSSHPDDSCSNSTDLENDISSSETSDATDSLESSSTSCISDETESVSEDDGFRPAVVVTEKLKSLRSSARVQSTTSVRRPRRSAAPRFACEQQREHETSSEDGSDCCDGSDDSGSNEQQQVRPTRSNRARNLSFTTSRNNSDLRFSENSSHADDDDDDEEELSYSSNRRRHRNQTETGRHGLDMPKRQKSTMPKQFVGEHFRRKPRTVRNVGSRRSVLQE